MTRMYTIVDIETTGGRKLDNKVIEIAIIKFDGKKIIDTFHSLINPERFIPFRITSLTGIDDSMVANAPKFFEVAKQIVEFTQDCVFVAHNVYFDYQFFQKEFSDLGYSFKRERLCTVRLARKYLPGHKSYSLGKICADLGISLENHHRAMDDTKATLDLFKLILNCPNFDFETSKVFISKQDISLPPFLDEKAIEELPEYPGVYYFYDKSGTLLYIGKSINIKKRVLSHFKINLKRKKDIELKNEISRIEYKEFASDLICKLFEANEIKTLKPLFNIALRQKRYQFGVYIDDSQELLELKPEKKQASREYLFCVSSKKVAQRKINRFYQSILSIDQDSLFFKDTINNYVNKFGIDLLNELIRSQIKLWYKKDYSGILKFQSRHRNVINVLEVDDAYPKSIYVLDNNEIIEEINLIFDEEIKDIFLKEVRNKNVKLQKKMRYD